MINQSDVFKFYVSQLIGNSVLMIVQYIYKNMYIYI